MCRYADNFACRFLSYRYGIPQHYEAAIKCKDFISGTFVRARARVPRARVSDPSLGLRFGDGRYAVNPRTSSRTRALIRVARLQRLYWYSRGIKCNSNTSARVYIILLFLYHWYVKSSNLCIIPLSIFFIFEGKYYRIDRLTVMRSRVMVRQATHAPS